MKKNILSVIAIIAIAVSCTVINEPFSPNPVSENETILQIRGNVNDVDTKTAITEDVSVFHSAWVDGNEIRVDVDGLKDMKTATYYSGTGLFSCSITGLDEGDHTVNAAYPSTTIIANSTKYSFTVPTSQTIPSVNAIDESADFLVAQTKVVSVDGSGNVSTVDMDFRRAVGIVKIIPVDGTTDPAKSLKGLKIKSITITSGVNLKTKIKITPGEEDDTIDTNASTFSVSYAGDDFEFNANKSGTDGAYFVFAPGKFTSGKSLKFDIETDDANYIISKNIVSLPADITFGANKLRPITVTFNDSCVDFAVPTITASNVTIEADDEGGTIDFTVSNLVDGGVVTKEELAGATISNLTVGAVSFDPSTGGGSISFTCDKNGDSANTKTATVRLTYTYNTDQTVTKDVTITQKKVASSSISYLWDFSSSDFSDANNSASTVLSSSQSPSSNTSITWNYIGVDLTYVANKSTYNGTYIQTGGSGSSTSRCFSFIAPESGTLTLSASSNGSSSRALTVTLDGDSVVASSGGTVTSTTPNSHVYNLTAGGTVVIYSSDGQIRYYSISYSNE